MKIAIFLLCHSEGGCRLTEESLTEILRLATLCGGLRMTKKGTRSKDMSPFLCTSKL